MANLSNDVCIDAAPNETRRRLVVTQKEINKWIEIRLQANGFDLSREILNWSLLDEKGSLSIVYEQRVDAPPTQEAKTQQLIDERPSYLRR